MGVAPDQLDRLDAGMVQDWLYFLASEGRARRHLEDSAARELKKAERKERPARRS